MRVYSVLPNDSGSFVVSDSVVCVDEWSSSRAIGAHNGPWDSKPRFAISVGNYVMFVKKTDSVNPLFSQR